ncbi:hypothetical protein Pcinc_026561 [Petrolisthes cinctipes]|uniref:Coiled-coil domain-containing protein 186 n=1 Tax=Petrolisthes cinctipes TaxID=88211 RepID=A0AAE1KC36_PETCI|nr:hypothetical protein Pcinc_026561 [Petrolisthes cinctipes]
MDMNSPQYSDSPPIPSTRVDGDVCEKLVDGNVITREEVMNDDTGKSVTDETDIPKKKMDTDIPGEGMKEDGGDDCCQTEQMDHFCSNIPSVDLHNGKSQQEGQSDLSIFGQTNKNDNEDVHRPESVKQVHNEKRMSLQIDNSCTLGDCESKDLKENRDCDLENLSCNEELELSGMLHDESVIEFSREKIGQKLGCTRVSDSSRPSEEKEMRTVRNTNSTGIESSVESIVSSLEKCDMNSRGTPEHVCGNDIQMVEQEETGQRCKAKNDIVNESRPTCDEASGERSLHNYSSKRDRLHNVSDSRNELSSESNGGDRWQNDSQHRKMKHDSSVGGHTLHGACASNSASSSFSTSSSPENGDCSDSSAVKNRSSDLERSDSSTSSESGQRSLMGVFSKDSRDSENSGTSSSADFSINPKSSTKLPGELESLMKTRHRPGTPDNSEFDITTLDFSSTPKHNLMKMLSGLLDECDALKKEKARLEGEVDRLEADQSSEVYASQIETLEKSLAQAQADACSWKEQLQKGEQWHMAEVVNIREDLTGRLERITQQYQAANKDKESMVIKYATSEREVILAKKQKEGVEKKLREFEKEREQLQAKNKMLISERARICQTLDTKVQKVNWYQREVERLKEEVNGREVKIKWAQTKLKTEMDAHQDCQGKLDRALTKITRHEEEVKEVRERAEGLVKATLDNQNSRANVLDMQLKEEKARVILERQVNEDRGSAYSRVSTDLEKLRTKHSALEEEAVSLRTRVASLECEREESEKLFSSLRAEVMNARQESSQLSLQLANSSHLQQQLDRERELVQSSGEEVERQQVVIAELEAELDACRTKEAELLAFTQKLSNKNVEIQSQFSALQSKNQLVEVERDEAVTELEEVRQQRAHLKADLARETHSHVTQVEELRHKLKEKTEEVEHLRTRVMDLESEIQVVNRKHTNALKDVTREMQKLRRRVEQQEDNGGGGEGMMSVGGGGNSGRCSQAADTFSQPSPASSNTSLNTLEYSSHSAHNGTHSTQQEGMMEPVVSQQVLVERIVRLQRAAAKRAEKIEFLEEHVAQLVGELKKKSRIIHHYIMKEETGALSSTASDNSKAEVLRHGGIMASVYGSSPRDSSMTLELSLEINTKLQAVLEDTLLKNITLKENLNTLGDEIAKISKQNQQLRNQK